MVFVQQKQDRTISIPTTLNAQSQDGFYTTCMRMGVCCKQNPAWTFITSSIPASSFHLPSLPPSLHPSLPPCLPPSHPPSLPPPSTLPSLPPSGVNIKHFGLLALWGQRLMEPTGPAGQVSCTTHWPLLLICHSKI